MKTEISKYPGPFAIHAAGNDAVISFYENPVEFYREGLSPLEANSTAWSVDEYRLTVPNRPSLAADVQEDLDLWLVLAKASENIEPPKTIDERVTTVEDVVTALSEVIL